MATEVKLSSKSQIVIPKDVRNKLGLKPGDRVKLEVVEGKRAIIQPAVKPSEELFISAGSKIVEVALHDARKIDEEKIKELLKALGVRD